MLFVARPLTSSDSDVDFQIPINRYIFGRKRRVSVVLGATLCNKDSLTQRNTEVAQRGAEKNL